MKTYAHINAAGEVVGIGMVYYESGELLPAVHAALIAAVDSGGTFDDALLAVGDSVKHDASLTTIVIDTATMPGGSGTGYDKTFRDSFKHAAGRVVVDLAKAKDITHSKRRIKRAGEFAPLDVEATIPAKATAAETARQAIRDRYATIQTEIDACADADALKALIAREAL